MCKYIKVFIGGEGKWSGNRIAYSVEPKGNRTRVVLKVATGEMAKYFKTEDVRVEGVIEK
jgi:hypothetical protein